LKLEEAQHARSAKLVPLCLITCATSHPLLSPLGLGRHAYAPKADNRWGGKPGANQVTTRLMLQISQHDEAHEPGLPEEPHPAETSTPFPFVPPSGSSTHTTTYLPNPCTIFTMWLLDTNSSSIAPIPQMEELIDSDLPEYAMEEVIDSDFPEYAILSRPSSIAPVPQMKEFTDSDLPKYAILSRPFPSLLSLRK